MNLALAEEIEYVRSTETLAVRLGGHRLITDAVLPPLNKSISRVRVGNIMNNIL